MRRIITFAMALGAAFMLIGGSVSGGQAAEAVIAAHRVTAHRVTAHRVTAHRVPGGAMKQVRFGGYTLAVPAGWPVYRLDRDPGRCVRYDQHAVYLGQPRADQQCPAHLVGRTGTISVQAGPRPAGGLAYGGPAISSLPGSGGPLTGDPASNLVQASLAGTGLSITGTYGGSPREVLSIIGSVRPVTATRSAHRAWARHHATARPPARPSAARPSARHAAARKGTAGLAMAGPARALPAGPARPSPPAAPGTTAPGASGPAATAPGTTGPGTVIPGTVIPGTVIPGTGGCGRTGPGATGPAASRPRARCTASTAARPPRWP